MNKVKIKKDFFFLIQKKLNLSLALVRLKVDHMH